MRSVDCGRVHLGPVGGIVNGRQKSKGKVILGKKNSKYYVKKVSGDSIGDHVENGAELGGLIEMASGHSVEEIKESARAVGEHKEGPGVKGRIDCRKREDDTQIPDEVRYEQVDVLSLRDFGR